MKYEMKALKKAKKIYVRQMEVALDQTRKFLAFVLGDDANLIITQRYS